MGQQAKSNRTGEIHQEKEQRPGAEKSQAAGTAEKDKECINGSVRLERMIAGLSLAEMLDDLPKTCGVGTKRNSKGYKRSWPGCKHHIVMSK